MVVRISTLILFFASSVAWGAEPVDELLSINEKADVDATPAEIDVTTMATLPVVLRDEAGEPVAGAEVRAYAMRMKEGGGHGYWDPKVYGPPKTIISNEQGKAAIRYPRHVRAGPRIMTTRLVTFSVTHADFIKETIHFDLGPDEAVVELKAGCEVRLSAADADRNPIHDFGVLMAGPQSPDLWAVEEDGTRRSRAVKEGMWQTMLVKLQDDGPTLFSHVLPLRFREGQQVRFRNVQLSPGVTVRGTLSAEVPRPVSGYVLATAIPQPAGNSWHREDPSLAWHDWTEVASDGTFIFQSLPRTGQLQLIVICEGWISTTKHEEARHQIMGQVFSIRDDDEQSVTVDMEPTGTLEVTLVTADGEPFTEGRISSWPNQRFLKGGSTLLGQRYRSAVWIRNQTRPPDERAPYYVSGELSFPYGQDVGGDGKVTLTGLPIRRPEEFVLRHDSFVLAEGGDRHEISFTLASPEVVKMRATVVPAARNEH